MAKVLVLYSSATGHPPLRLDLEDRWTEKALRKHGLDPRDLTRQHATTLRDLVDAISGETRFDIIVFSGHGSPDSFIIEDEPNERPVEIDYGTIAALVAREQPQLKAALFMSCTSMDSADALRRVAPYVIVIAGVADDRLAARFSAEFLDAFFAGKSIEHSFFLAQRTITILEAGERPPYLSDVALQTTLLRRNEHTLPGVVRAQVSAGRIRQTLLVDIRPAMESVKRLGVDIDEFSESVSRKLFLHLPLFDVPRERVYLPVGRSIALFSWSNPLDLITCHDVFVFRGDVTALDVSTFVELVVRYNEWSNLEYRRVNHPSSDLNRPLLVEASRHARQLLEFLASREGAADRILWTELASDFEMTLGALRASLNVLNERLDQGDGRSAVTQLEFALSSVHDLLISSVKRLATP